MDPPSPVSQVLPAILYFSFLVLTFPLFTTAQEQTHQNISLGSFLTPLGQPKSWVSPSGDFAFGFLPLDPNNLSSPFILGVYFNRVPDKTLVWYANGGSPVQGGAKVELTTGGKLVLQDHGGNSVWRNNYGSNITHAAMLDNGNFVLANMTSSTWETFQNPTDTILPEQTLDLGAKLTAHLTNTDYSQGRFQLSVESSGDLALFPINIETGIQYHKQYWNLGTSGNGSKLVFDKSGELFVVLRNGSVANVFSSPEGKQSIYRATLETDGVFRYYLLPNNGTSNSDQWMMLSQQPGDICDSLNGEIGLGSACGYNSYCFQNGTDSRTYCLCPAGYSFLDADRKYLGCQPDIPLPPCNGSEVDLNAYLFTEMMNVEWLFSDYEQYSPFTEDECRAECLKDCFCAVAIYRNVSCWKKQFPLANGFGNSNNQGKVLLKIANENYSKSCAEVNPPQVIQENKSKWFVTGVVLISSSVFLFLSMLVIFPLLYSRAGRRRMALLQRPDQSQSPDIDSYFGIKMQSFTFKSLQEATRNFEEEIGRGAFGVVYRGTLSSSNNKVRNVAVKVIHQFMERVEKEFLNEVKSIGQTHHKNLVRLFGYCNERSHRMLVYEFMENGSLACLFSRNPRLSWEGRTQIAYGIAKGLLYLHEECETQIIHCDIKPENILLDESLVAKISDFGLAKLLKADQTQTSTGIRGTRGYVAPEWFKGRTISTKVDVYSFGVILLEIICCRKNVKREFGESERGILTDWAYDCYAEEKLDLLVEDDEEGREINMREFERYVMVALWCIQEEPTRRPSMRKVTQLLEGDVDVAVPPDPSTL